jgi:hypothetical protein
LIRERLNQCQPPCCGALDFDVLACQEAAERQQAESEDQKNSSPVEQAA